MIRYLEANQIKGRFFLLYYLYSKNKFAKGTESTLHRVGALSAYKSMMNLYREFVLLSDRVLLSYINTQIDALRQQALQSLPDGEFRRTFLSTIDKLHNDTI